ncbi:MAG: cobalamin-binding protein [Spirochaetota bacterium]
MLSKRILFIFAQLLIFGAYCYSFPLTVIDSLGREVLIKKIPDRIVSLSPSGTEMLFSAGAGPRVVGVTSYCTYPPDAKTREIVGGFSGESISIEKIISLSPDIVFSGGAFHRTVIEALVKAGITVFSLDAQNLEKIYAAIETLGLITGRATQAAERLAYMRATEKKITEAVSKIPLTDRVRVFWEIWDQPLMTVGKNAFMGQIIEKTGGINIFNDLKADYPVISEESIIERNPDVIMGPQSHATSLNAEKISSRPGWQNINAVRKNRIYTLDDDITSRPGPRVINAMGLVFRALYPAFFSSVFGDTDPIGW